MRPGWAGLEWLDVPRAGCWRRARVVIAVVVCLGLFAVSGCGGDGDPEPKFSESSDASSSAGGDPSTSSPTDDPSGGGSEGSEPVMPAKAKKKGFAGAKAFTKYFYEEFDYALRTNAPGRLRSLSLSSCTSCRRIADKISQANRKGRELRHAGLAASKFFFADGTTKVRPIFLLSVLERPSRQLNAAGKVVARTSKVRTAQRIGLAWTGAAWRVVEFEVIQ